MKNIMKDINKGLRELVRLDDKIRKLPQPSEIERESLHSRHRFEATYNSNRLEGNKLTRKEAKEAIMF